jgi:HSP20 family protein
MKEEAMELMKLKDIVPWKRKPVEREDVLSLRDDINEVSDQFLTAPFEAMWSGGATRRHGVEMTDTEDEVIAQVEVPGLDPKRMNVEVRNGYLHIGYEQEQEWHGNGNGRRHAAFHRSIALPDGIDASQAEASCKHGLLTVRIPWSREARDRAHRIDVSVD